MTVLLPAAAARAVLAAVPVEPDPDRARDWAVEELSRREYADQRPGVVAQILDWLLDWVQDRLGALDNGTAAGHGTLLALVVGIVVVLVVVAVLVAGRTLRRARQPAPGAVFDDTPQRATDHRRAADAAAARGDWRTAVLERFRAVVRALEEHAVLVPEPGRTADEAARDAARWLPDLGVALAAGARLFDDVRYGDRPGDAAADDTLRALDGAVRTARVAVPVSGTTSGTVTDAEAQR